MLPVGRLAPSPTGLLHLGHARTFLVAWWYTRSRGGSVLLRMEDLDGARSTGDLASQALRDLEWLGLDWDGPAYVQSEGIERLMASIRLLLSKGQAYACSCSRRDVLTAQSAPNLGSAEPRYPGTCRARYVSLVEAERASGGAAGVRLFVSPGSVHFRDEVFGDQAFDVEGDVGDFLIARRDGAPAYQLAVVVDDAAQGVTEVVRGSDLLASTARQRLLQLALGLPEPRWVHVPLVLDETGRRLAKHERDLGLAELRSRGVDPRSIVAWAARSAGLDAPAPLTARDALDAFDLDGLPKTPLTLRQEDVQALFPR